MPTVTRLALPVALLAIVAGCSGGAPASTGPASSGGAASATPALTTTPVTSPTAAAAGDLPVLKLQATVDGLEGPSDLVSTANAIWVLEHSTATLERIDPATNSLTAKISLGAGYANGLGVAAGRLWAFDQTGGQVIGIDPASGKIVAKVKLGQDGDSFWVGDEAAWLLSSPTLARIDSATSKVTKQRIDDTCSADGATAGAGFVWLASAAGSLCKLDEKTGHVITRGSGTGNGNAIAIVAGVPWIAGADGGLSIVDPVSLAVTTALPAAASGTFEGSKYSIGAPDENAVVVGTADGKTGWVRNSGATIGRVDRTGTGSVVLFAGLPVSNVPGGVVEAFGSVWLANFDAGSVQRYALPTP
jgi:hypothetical protein